MIGRSSRVVLIACAAALALAVAPAVEAKPRLVVKERDQKALLELGGIPVVAKGLDGESLDVRALSRTFDSPEPSRLASGLELGAGEREGVLPFTQRGRKQVRRCQPREVMVRAAGAKGDEFDLRRTSRRCRPKPIDLTSAAECDPITMDQGEDSDERLCMLPFPDNFHTVRDPESATGRRVAFDDTAMPQNSGSAPIDAAPYNRNDGFSPGQTIVARVPGLGTPEALEQTDPITLDNLSRNDAERPREPVVVINAETGERWPIWVEIDSNAGAPAETALLIHPAVNFASGDRYVVALRDMRGPENGKLRAPEGFRLYRDDLPSRKPAVNAQRPRFERIFRELRRAGVRRAGLYLAWDFTVSSDESIAERLLAIRDDAFAELGDTDLDDQTIQGDAPDFTISSVQEFTPGEDAQLARRVQGTFEVPCYLEPDCAPGGRFDLDANGLPERNGTYTASFNCGIPRAAVDAPGAAPGRPQVYGHGLLGSRNEATSGAQQTLGQAHNFTICGTDTIGFSSGDVPNIAANILPDLGNFPELTDRVQQGLLNTLYLGRLMWHPDGLVSDAAFHVDSGDAGSPPVMDVSRLYYNGNSQGGILGGAATAVAPDWTRATLGVPAMNYSVLLNRSVDFDTYSLILDPAYPSPLTQQLALAMIQMLWDRSDPNGYAHRMTDDPLPDTPPHEVLLNVAFGDHQVTTWQADVEARTIGAQIREPVVYDGRWPGVDVGWGIDPIASYPYSGSAIVYWDSGPVRPDPGNPSEDIGTDPPPVENLPNRTGKDPHGDPRIEPEEMQMVSDFLRPDAQSEITDTCGALPCFAGGFTGP